MHNTGDFIMSLYEGIKDVAKVVQKADNIDLYRQLLDLGQQALDMQEEIRQLKQENYELKKKQDVESQIERHEQPYITLKNDNQSIIYCSACWDNNQKIVQVRCDGNGRFKCPICNNEGIYNEEMSKKHYEKMTAIMGRGYNY